MSAMTDVGFWCALFISWVAAAAGWIKWLYEIREKNEEKAGKERAEAALAEARRRATDNSPYLKVSEVRFDSLIVPSTEFGSRLSYSPTNGCLLSFMRAEVRRDEKEGNSVYLLVENHGSAAPEVAVELDGERIELVPAEANGGEAIYAIRYTYRPNHHGKSQTLQITFLAKNGFRDIHRYETRHGVRALRRIEPV